jgi:hypothetical protein
MWKPWKRRPRLATGGYVGPGAYVLGDVNADPCVLPPSAAISLPDAKPVAEMNPHRPPPIEVRIGVIPSEAEFVAMIRRAFRGSEGMP